MMTLKEKLDLLERLNSGDFVTLTLDSGHERSVRISRLTDDGFHVYLTVGTGEFIDLDRVRSIKRYN